MYEETLGGARVRLNMNRGQGFTFFFVWAYMRASFTFFYIIIFICLLLVSSLLAGSVPPDPLWLQRETPPLVLLLLCEAHSNPGHLLLDFRAREGNTFASAVGEGRKRFRPPSRYPHTDPKRIQGAQEAGHLGHVQWSLMRGRSYGTAEAPLACVVQFVWLHLYCA